MTTSLRNTPFVVDPIHAVVFRSMKKYKPCMPQNGHSSQCFAPVERKIVKARLTPTLVGLESLYMHSPHSMYLMLSKL